MNILFYKVYVRRSIHEKIDGQGKMEKNDLPGDKGIPMVRKSKLLIVDLAGSERLDKSGLLNTSYIS